MRIRRILDNIEIKLICLVLAIIMWLYANESPEIMNRAIAGILKTDRGIITLREVPVKVDGTGQEDEWIAEPKRVSIEVTCPMTAEIDVANLQIVVKLTRKDKDNHQLLLKADNVILPKGLRFIRTEPKEIQISKRK